MCFHFVPVLSPMLGRQGHIVNPKPEFRLAHWASRAHCTAIGHRSDLEVLLLRRPGFGFSEIATIIPNPRPNTFLHMTPCSKTRFHVCTQSVQVEPSTLVGLPVWTAYEVSRPFSFNLTLAPLRKVEIPYTQKGPV